MPIHSGVASDATQRQSNMWAAAGVTSSLAAAAAEMLREDPGRPVPERLSNALRSMRDEISQIKTFAVNDRETLYQQQIDSRPEPELLIAQLAGGSTDEEGELRTETVRDLSSLLESIEVLLRDPNREAAARVEAFLSQLSQVEISLAQEGSSARSDVETALRPSVVVA